MGYPKCRNHVEYKVGFRTGVLHFIYSFLVFINRIDFDSHTHTSARVHARTHARARSHTHAHLICYIWANKLFFILQLKLFSCLVEQLDYNCLLMRVRSEKD